MVLWDAKTSVTSLSRGGEGGNERGARQKFQERRVLMNCLLHLPCATPWRTTLELLSLDLCSFFRQNGANPRAFLTLHLEARLPLSLSLSLFRSLFRNEISVFFQIASLFFEKTTSKRRRNKCRHKSLSIFLSAFGKYIIR